VSASHDRASRINRSLVSVMKNRAGVAQW